MSSLNEIKKKIKVVESTSKITNAMKLIATSKLKKQKDIFASTNQYYLSMYKIFGELIKDIDESEFKVKSDLDITLWILFTSSMGLCGSYNINIIKLLKENIKDNDLIIVFGRKGSNLLKSKNINNTILMNLELDDKEINFDVFDLLSFELIKLYKEKKFSTAKIIYTKYVNSLIFEPTIYNLIPFDKEHFQGLSKPVSGGYYVAEPNATKLFKFIFEKYICSILLGTITESKISENASRRNAMEGATKNANELISNYKLNYNRVRQSDITQEITEIISGSKVGE